MTSPPPLDAYGDVVDLRAPGPAGRGLIANPFERQAAGSVAADTGIVVRVAAGAGDPLPLWRADRIRQRYLRRTNVLRTSARIGGARVSLTDAARGGALARRIEVRGPPGERLRLLLGLNLSGAGACRPAGADAERGDERLEWRGRGRVSAGLLCDLGASPGARSPASVIAAAARADRRWLTRAGPLGPDAPAWAVAMRERSLLVLRALTDRRSGAAVAGVRDGWAYVWPRDAAAAAIALSSAGYRREARRVSAFLGSLELAAGARFHADGSAVGDGREAQGDAAGWVRAAALATGRPAPRRSGPLLAIPRRLRRALGGERGLPRQRDRRRRRGARDPLAVRRPRRGSSAAPGIPAPGIDSAAAWAARPFPRPALAGQVRRSLRTLLAAGGRFGIEPSEDWPGEDPWSAPTAWSAWGLAALGDREGASRLLADLRRAATPLGTLPERVAAASGIPRSTTPLGWSHAFTSLALEEVFPPQRAGG